MQTEVHNQKGIGQEIVEVKKNRTFQGLQIGQVVARKIHRGKENNRYVAFTQVFVRSNDKITDIDNRIILIENEDTINDSLLGKFGLFRINQVEETYYVAYKFVATVEVGHEYFDSNFISL